MHVAATLRKPRRADDGERWYKGTLTEQQGAYTKIWHVEGYTPVLGIKPMEGVPHQIDKKHSLKHPRIKNLS